MYTQAEVSSSPHQQDDDDEEEEEEEEEANLSPTQLLQLAETHLRLRNFSLCHQYALESQRHQHSQNPNSLSNHRHASQLLAISNILSSPTNYYSILQIDTFSNDITLIRSQFNHLLFILDPIKDKSSLANEAVSLVWKAYRCLSDPVEKTQFDAQKVGFNDGEEVGTFWTFCPYCFYMYQYVRVYEGCCLRCQNQSCRRAFHGVALYSLPEMELDKGLYLSCFGYFPLGFSPEEKVRSGKFDSWSPIVGMFTVRRIGKTRVNRVDLNGDNNDNVDMNGGNDDFVEVLDESEESENDEGVKGRNFGSNVGGNIEKPRMMKRKSVAWNARKLMSRGRSGNAGAPVYGFGDDIKDVGYGFEGDRGGLGGGSVFGTEDMAFFEEDGEIFVGFGPDGAL